MSSVSGGYSLQEIQQFMVDNGLETDDPNLMLMSLQLLMSEDSHTNAMSKISDIEKIQEEQQKVADMLQQARQLRTDAANSSSDCTSMPQSMANYLDANGLAYDKEGGDLINNAEEWDVAIASLQAHSESLGTSIQTEMIYIEQLMGEYESYLSGAKDTNSKYLNVMSTIAGNIN